MVQVILTGSSSGHARAVKDGAVHRKTTMTSDADNPLKGMRALLVEDQILIALDTEMLLRELGAETVETLSSTETALQWLATATPDVAVLDINLGTSSPFAVADEMLRRQRPFIFTTGYGEGFAIPDPYGDVPVVRKPYTRESLSQAFAACLGRGEADT